MEIQVTISVLSLLGGILKVGDVDIGFGVKHAMFGGEIGGLG